MAAVTGMALMVVALIAGCGGSSDDGPSKSEFLTKANAICTKGTEEINAATSEQFGPDGPTTEEDSAQFITETVVPSIQSQVDQIKALDPPSGDEDQIAAITDGAEAAIAQVNEDPSLASSGTSPFAESDKLATEYGLTECASSSA
jgi:hypothetical protein